jgi:ferredoxin
MSALITKLSEDRHEGKNPKRKYSVEILRDVCIGAGSCVAIAPETFRLDGENKVVLVESDWDEDEIILAAAQSCPVFAIIVKDAETGKQLFPVD